MYMLIVVVLLFGLSALGFPIYVGILASTIYLQIFVNHMPLQSLFTGMFEAMNKNSLMAIPYFVVAGNLIAHSSLGKRLINVFIVFFKRIRGGLAVASIVTNGVFGAISGSPPAATATFGKIIYEPLKERYNESLSLGVVTSAGALASIIPPSMVLIIYGITTDTSIGNLFKAGILPGILLVLLLCIYLVCICKPTSTEPFAKGERMSALRQAIPVLLLPIIILGGIYGGFFTPTEAGAVSSLYSFIVTVFLLKDIKIKELPAVLKDCAFTLGQLFILIASSTVFAKALNISQAPQLLAQVFSSLGKIPFIMLLNVLLLIVGCFFDTGAAVMIFAPLLFATAVELGIDPIHLGLIFTVNLSIGMFTPPFGMNIFVAQSILDVPMSRIAKGVVPFLIVYIVGLLIISYWPWLSLALL